MKIIDYRFGNTIPFLMKRHFRSMYMSITPKKVLNALNFFFEFNLKKRVIDSYPLYIKIEPTNCCDHFCPNCASGNWRPKGFMDWELYKRIINDVKPWCMRNCLYGQGESFLHPDIFRMIQYSEERKCPVSISTNFNNVSFDGIQSILDAGLDYIIICIDGATQQSHSRYRRGGDLEKVLKNLQYLSSQRSKGNYKKPTIEIQTAMFEYIKGEMAQISRMVSERGADIHMIREDMYNKNIKRSPRSSCPYLWGSQFFTWEGKVYPCEEFCNEKHISPISSNLEHEIISRNDNIQTMCRDFVVKPGKVTSDTTIRCSTCHHYS